MGINRELIYYDNKYLGEHGDFSGNEEAFNAEERLEYLAHYAQYIKRTNRNANDGISADRYLKKSEKAVTEEEITKAFQYVNYSVLPKVRGRIEIETAEAYTKKKAEQYKGWQLYTYRATVNEGKYVSFNDGITPPLPCAKYRFEKDGVVSVALSVYISEEYHQKMSDGVAYGVMSGRILELRRGKDEIIKIQFYPNGETYARIGVPDKYHHRNVLLGKCKFGAWNFLHISEIAAHGNTYDVAFNGKKTENLQLTNNLSPTELFISGGLHPRGEWRVRPEKIEFSDGTEQINFFERAKTEDCPETALGNVKLPYAIGGYYHRDEYLILKKKFTVPKGKRAFLHAESLDPCGKVEINGKEVFYADSFESRCVEITQYLKENAKESELVITVFPRAPETPYPWHKSADTYHGWFAGETSIEYVADSYITDLQVETVKVYNGKADIKINAAIESNNLSGKSIRFYLCRAKSKEETVIATVPANKKTETRLTVNVNLWSAENPVLYNIRAELTDENSEAIDDYIVETGFRTIEQKNGDIYLNNEKIFLRGALIMQFMPPCDNIPISHVCPTDRELIWQFAMLKKMNANFARLHLLGYGTSDKRYASFCDRMGIMLAWITRYIDSVESVAWDGDWKQGKLYVKQMHEVKNHPSIIMWEGSNEYHAGRKDLDCLYDEFVKYVKKEDPTRLLSPCSHQYYGSVTPGAKCFYYNDDGTKDQDGNPAQSSFGWNDENVVRSVHPYYYTLGYGTRWDAFRKQAWPGHKEILNSRKHAYLATEIATIGRQDDTTPECERYVKNDSYELGDERSALGVKLEQKDFLLSQAYQALCAAKAIQFLRANDADGVAWCALQSGANDASYLKPPVDFYGYAKLSYYVIAENFRETIAFNEKTNVKFGRHTGIAPCVCGAKCGKRYKLEIIVQDERENVIDAKVYDDICGSDAPIHLEEWIPNYTRDGYYSLAYNLSEKV